MVIITKMCLSNSLKNRVFTAILIRCYQVSTESDVVVKCKAATSKFEAVQKELKEEQSMANHNIKDKIGIPSVHVVNTLLAMAEAKVKGTELGAKLTETIQKWKEEGKDWRHIHHAVPHARISKMYESSSKRLELSIPQATRVNTDNLLASEPKDCTWAVMVAIQHVVHQCPGFRLLEGIAPAGDLERKAQAWLDELKD